MCHNLHSHFHAGKVVLSRFPLLGPAGLLLPAQLCLPLLPPSPSTRMTMNSQDMELQESMIWLLFEPRSLGPACPMWGPGADTGPQPPCRPLAWTAGLGPVSC